MTSLASEVLVAMCFTKGDELFFEHKKSPGVFPGLLKVAILFRIN